MGTGKTHLKSLFNRSKTHWSTGQIIISADPGRPAIQAVRGRPVSDHHLSGRWFLTGIAVLPLVLWSVAEVNESLQSAGSGHAAVAITVLPHVPTKAELAKNTTLPDFVSVPIQE